MNKIHDLQINPEPTPKHLSWVDIWRIALFHPSVKQLSMVSKDPKAGFGRGILWMSIGLLIAWGLGPERQMLSGWVSMIFGISNLNMLYLLGILAIPFLGTIGFLLSGVFTQGFARLFKGKGTTQWLVYTWAVTQLPFLLLSRVPSFLSSLLLQFISYRSTGGIIGSLIAILLFIALNIYGSYVAVAAFCAVQGFTFWKGFGVLFLLALLISIIGACLSMGINALFPYPQYY